MFVRKVEVLDIRRGSTGGLYEYNVFYRSWQVVDTKRYDAETALGRCPVICPLNKTQILVLGGRFNEVDAATGDNALD